MKQTEVDELEAMIDLENLASLLETISDICHAKAEHIASNWQDPYTAAPWRRAGVLIARLSQQVEI